VRAPVTRSAAGLVFALSLGAGVGVARADAPPAPPVVTLPAGVPAPAPRDRTWSVRGEVFVLSGAGMLGPAASSVGLTAQKILFERWAWEETVAWGIGNRQLDGKDLGLNLAGTLRFAPFMNAARTRALSLGLGTSFIFGGGYGHLHFVYAELGYALRSRNGFNALLAVGPNLLYAASDRPRCSGSDDFCGAFHAGGFAGLGHVRAGLGWSF
jgi:hypothetical protein